MLTSIVQNRARAALFYIVLLCALFTFSTHVSAHEGSPIHGAKSTSLSEDSNKIFILNEDSTLSVYNPETSLFELVAKPFSFFATQPHEILVSPSGEYLLESGDSFNERYIGLHSVFDILNDNLDGQTAYGWDTSYLTGKSEGVLKVGFSNDNNHLYFADSSTGEISILKIDSRELSAVGNFTGTLQGIVSDTNGTRLFVLTQNPNQVSVYDTQTKTITGTYPVGSVASQLLFDEEREKIYISNRGDGTVTIVNLTTKSKKELVVGPHPVSLTLDNKTGAVFVVNNGDGTISQISKDVVLKSAKIGPPAYARSSPITIVYSDKGKALYALNASARKLSVIDPNTLTVLEEKKVDSTRIRGFIGYDNSSFGVVEQSDSDSVIVLNLKSKEITQVPAEVTESEGSAFSNPQSIVVDYDSGRIYVSNLSSGDISVIDGSNYSILRKIPVGANPQVIYLNQTTKKLYVSDSVDYTISIVDTQSPDYTTTIIPTEGMPRTVWGNETTNRQYVSLAEEKKVLVINGETDSVLTTINLGNKAIFPVILAVNETKNMVYVADYGGDTVFVINGETNTVEESIVVGKNPLWVRYVEGLDLVMVTVEGEEAVVVIDPSTNAVIEKITITGTPYRISVDSATNLVYVTHRGENVVSVLGKTESGIQLLQETPIDFIGELDIHYNMMFGNNGKDSTKLYITQASANRLVITDTFRDDNNILRPQLIAFVEKYGEMLYTEDNQPTEDGVIGDTEGTREKNSNLPYYVILLAIILGLLGVFLIMRRKNE